MDNEIINLKKNLKEYISKFNAKNNRYNNPKFLSSIVPNNEFIGQGIGMVKAETIANTISATVAALVGRILKKAKNIDDIKKEVEKMGKDKKFNIYLQKIIIEKGMENSVVIRKSNIHKSYFYQILRGEKLPSRDRIIQIAIALNLNIQETNRMLMTQGYILYGGNPRDFIILYGIENNIDLVDIDIMLTEYNEKPLQSIS